MSMKFFEWVCLCLEYFIILYNKECFFLKFFFIGVVFEELMIKGIQLYDCKGNKVYIVLKVVYSVGFRLFFNYQIVFWVLGKYI